jgi:hypothetical protein
MAILKRKELFYRHEADISGSANRMRRGAITESKIRPCYGEKGDRYNIEDDRFDHIIEKKLSGYFLRFFFVRDRCNYRYSP